MLSINFHSFHEGHSLIVVVYQRRSPMMDYTHILRVHSQPHGIGNFEKRAEYSSDSVKIKASFFPSLNHKRKKDLTLHLLSSVSYKTFPSSFLLTVALFPPNVGLLSHYRIKRYSGIKEENSTSKTQRKQKVTTTQEEREKKNTPISSLALITETQFKIS